MFANAGGHLAVAHEGCAGVFDARAAWLAPRSEGFARAEAFRKQVGWPPTEKAAGSSATGNARG